MPSVSTKQQHMMGMALAIKRGKRVKASPKAKKIAQSMSENQLMDFATERTSMPMRKPMMMG